MSDETAFGTEYHDGSGFADCDPTGSGNRLCKGLPETEMCSECIYLSRAERENLKCLGFRPQSAIGQCKGCKAVCEECELLMIVEDEEDFRKRIMKKKKTNK